MATADGQPASGLESSLGVTLSFRKKIIINGKIGFCPYTLKLASTNRQSTWWPSKKNLAGRRFMTLPFSPGRKLIFFNPPPPGAQTPPKSPKNGRKRLIPLPNTKTSTSPHPKLELRGPGFVPKPETHRVGDHRLPHEIIFREWDGMMEGLLPLVPLKVFF